MSHGLYARDLISAKRMSTGSVTTQPRAYGMKSSKSNEARITVSFPFATHPVSVYHGLGFTPTGAFVVSRNTAGNVYTDVPLVADSRSIVLYCSLSNTVAEVIVR